MKKMSFVKMILLSFLAMFYVTVNAQVATDTITRGLVHYHPLDKATVVDYLAKYCGLDENGSSSNWSEPTAVKPGDVIFVEVNDYWYTPGNSSGDRWRNAASLYDQMKYAIKKITPVTNSMDIATGKLFALPALTNRFFFAARTSTRYTGENGKVLFAWYNEFSATDNTDNGWNELIASYAELQDGSFKQVPHSCRSSIVNNHYTTLYDKETTEQAYSVQAFLYIPTGIDLTVNNKPNNFTTVPYVFFYVNELEGELVEDKSDNPVPCGYLANLNWETSFDKAVNKQRINFKDYEENKDGVKEVSKIYRRIEGQDNFELVAQNIVELKEWTDNTLPIPEGYEGYEVEYYVVTEVYKYDAAGNKGDYVAEAGTNQITLYVPPVGKVYSFNLTIDGGHDSKFNPNANNIHNSTNTVTNTIIPIVNDKTPEVTHYGVGDKFLLYRYEDGEADMVLQTATITGAVENGTITPKATFTETFADAVANSSSIQNDLNDYTDNNDWSSNKYVYGIAGGIKLGQGTSSGSSTGNITTPPIDLSNSGGKVTIKIRAKGLGGQTHRGLSVKASGKSGSTVQCTTDESELSITINCNAATNQTITFTSPSKGPIEIYNIEIIPGNGKAITGYSFKYTIDNGDEQEWTGNSQPTKQEFLEAVGSKTDNLNSVPGQTHSAQYQLIYVPETTDSQHERLESNRVECKGLHTTGSAVKAFRSGTPDKVNNPVEELYNFNVKFRPIYGSDVASYYIWQNTERQIARIDQVNGNQFQRIYQDNNGNWNIAGEYLTIDPEGNVVVNVAYSSTTHVHEGEYYEDTSVSASFETLYYTIEVVKTNGATYGNYDYITAFDGVQSELVVNAEAEFVKAAISAGAGREYRANITWEPNESFLSTLSRQGLELQYYTVHRRLPGANGYSLLTTSYTNVDNSQHPEVKDKNDDGVKIYPEDTLEFVDLFGLSDYTSDIFPATYYVKAHFAYVNGKQNAPSWLKADETPVNVLEKNSNAIISSVTNPVVTAVKDITATSNESELYYDVYGHSSRVPFEGINIYKGKKVLF